MNRILILLFVVCLFSCGEAPFYSSTLEVDSSGWTAEQPISFSAEIQDTTLNYELQLIVNHSSSYTYENVYLRITTNFPDRESQMEQLTIDLATNKGVWVGKCSGDNCKCKVYLLQDFKFPSAGTYSFDIQQYTRDESLKGINDLTLEIHKKVKA